MSQGKAHKSPQKKAYDLCSRKIPLAPELRKDDRAVLLKAKGRWELIAEGHVRADGVLGWGCAGRARQWDSGYVFGDKISCSDRLDVGLAVGGEKLGLTLGSWTEQLRGWMVALSNNMGTTSVKGTHFKKKIDSFI